MYTAGQLAKALGRKTQVVRVWEKKGHFPQAMYRSASNDRLYTELQFLKIIEIYKKLEKEHGELMRTRISWTGFFEAVHDFWKEFPLGIDLSS